MAEPRDIFWRLRAFHRGQNNKVSAKDLAAHFGMGTRQVREAISELRRQTVPICSTHEGFWWPVSREDAQAGAGLITKMFKPLREAEDGFFAGLQKEFGQDDLFSQLPLEEAS